jgi:glycosyltransferase involved in cell wall biosynthesis
MEMEQGKTKKKIIIIAPAYPYRGGQALDEAYLYKMITDFGLSCQTISYTLLYPSFLFPGKTQYDDSKIIPFAHQDKVKRMINSINPFSWIKVYREIKKENPSCVIFLWWMFFFAPCLGTIAHTIKLFQKQIKVCFLADNYISHENHFYEKFLVKMTFRHSDYFISASKFIEQQIKKDFPKKPIYCTTLSIYDCYNLNRYDKNTAKDFLNIKTDEVILFFGLIRPYKGLDKLIESFKDIKNNRKSVTLLVVGECYGDINQYKNQIKELNLEKDVVLVNKYIANEDIEPYFKASDVVALPYYSATQSGVVMTSYAFRKPVVATNVGGVKEEVEQGKTGIIIDNNNKENLVSAIEEILNNKDTIDYESNIEKYIDKFGNENLRKFLADLLINN